MFSRLRQCVCDWLCQGSSAADAAPAQLPDLAPPARRNTRPVPPAVVVYLPDLAPGADSSDEALAQALANYPGWAEFTKTYGGDVALAPRRAFKNSPALDKLIAQANQNAERSGVRGYRPLDYQRYVVLSMPKASTQPTLDSYCEIKAGLQRIGGRVSLSMPTRGAQASDAYLGAAGQPGGIGGIGAAQLRSRHTERLIDGDGQWIVDVEKAWVTTSPQMTNLPTSLSVVESAELGDVHHGTAVAGIVLGMGGLAPSGGIAPRARFFKAACLELGGASDPSMIMAATILAGGVQLSQSPRGTGILLIQQETWDRLPIETQPLEFAAIQTVAAAGHIVIQPAGNGGLNLDDVPGFWVDPANQIVERPLNPNLPGPTSGAIVVAAGCSGLSPSLGNFGQAHPDTNHGQLIDCWAWGDSIATLGATRDANGNLVAFADPAGFGGSSGAAAIVAGAAALMQQLRAEANLPPLNPRELRELLRNLQLGTPGQGTLEVRPMPDLARLKPLLEPQLP